MKVNKYQKNMIKILLISVFIFNLNTAIACQFTTDCDVGSKCYKPNGSLYGWCVGGLNPGNSNDKQPAYDPLDITGKKAALVLLT